jgi:hypothetical protein
MAVLTSWASCPEEPGAAAAGVEEPKRPILDVLLFAMIKKDGDGANGVIRAVVVENDVDRI